jgi:hypothetical protein
MSVVFPIPNSVARLMRGALPVPTLDTLLSPARVTFSGAGLMLESRQTLIPSEKCNCRILKKSQSRPVVIDATHCAVHVPRIGENSWPEES